MQKILAIAWLTWKAALRFRLFLVIAGLLILAVVGLPLVVKSDGTAQGFTQIILTYTLSAVTVLLGFSTLWLACGTLARDIEECQIQVVATKPISRWQIWLGKWLGIVTLNAALLALSGACIYGMLQWRATRLPPAEQAKLRSDVLVARGSVKPPSGEEQIDEDTMRVFQDRLKQQPELANLSPDDKQQAINQIREEVKAGLQIVPPDIIRVWRLKLGLAKNFLRDKPMQLRIKFNTANPYSEATYVGVWQIGDPSGNYWLTNFESLAANTYHEFDIPPNLFDKDGNLIIAFKNVNDTSLLFPLEDGIEVLYPEGGFTLNFARGLGIIFCWMALLAALGLASSSFLTFPVAAFFSLAVMVIVCSSGTLAEAVANGTVGVGNEESTVGHTPMDVVLIPMFKAILTVINLAKNFSPIDSLSDGRAISWEELATAFGQVVLLLGGIIALIGISLFNRRELATAQGNQ